MSLFTTFELLQLLENAQPIWSETFEHIDCYAFAPAVRKCLESPEAKKIKLQKRDIFGDERNAVCAFADLFEKREKNDNFEVTRQAVYFKNNHCKEILALCILLAFNVLKSNPELESRFVAASERAQGEMLRENAPRAFFIWERLH